MGAANTLCSRAFIPIATDGAQIHLGRLVLRLFSRAIDLSFI
jgi:hypothetical protein